MSISRGFDGFYNKVAQPINSFQRSVDGVSMKINDVSSRVDEAISFGSHAVGIVDNSLNKVINYGKQLDSIVNKVGGLFGQDINLFNSRDGLGAAIPSLTDFTKINVISYPGEVGKFRMHLRIGPWSRPSRSTSYAKTGFTPDTEIILPIPAQLSESFGVSYSIDELGFVGDILSYADQLGENEKIDLGDALAKATANVGAKAAARRGVASGLPSGIMTGITSSFGSIFNPHMAVGFKGIEFRKHAFRFRFAPSSPSESRILQNICNIMKARALPSTDQNATAIVLNYPDIFEIVMEPNRSMPKFKKSVLESFSFNYSPNGIPAFFQGTDAPVLVEITMSFVEIEYFLANDIFPYRESDSSTSAGDAFGQTRGTGFNGMLDTIGTALKDLVS